MAPAKGSHMKSVLKVVGTIIGLVLLYVGAIVGNVFGEHRGPGIIEGQGLQVTGWVDHDQLATWYQRAQALLIPSRWQEPFGIVGLEALAVGTPVIVAAVGGTEDWSEQGCVRVPSAGTMADAIHLMAEDEAEVAELGRAGWRAVQDRFTEAEAMEKLERIYGAVCDPAQ